ncbi:MAG: protein translocase subunit SecD [Patescibacteria group bacterium]
MTSKLSLLIIILVSIFLGFFVYPQAWDKIADKVNAPHLTFAPPFRLGLDLQGGAHLEYQADLSDLNQDPKAAMASVRDVIERRVNLFGVSEPNVQIEGNDRLIVELAGIQDIDEAKSLIGQTPFLEFRELSDDTASASFIPTGLTGRHLKKSAWQNDPTTNQPQVELNLTDEGTKLFAEITRKNLNKPVAIFLDGQPISIPIVQSEITDGKAIISGQFMLQEVKDLVGRLNAGALPVPITLISQQTIGASLGAESLSTSLRAGLYALLAVALFMILFYRLPGVAAVLALIIYTILVLTIYKLLPVTITLAGIAGFILSLGIAVDANVLIFARLREELKAGRTLPQSIHEGFHRAWYSIRDSHVTTLLGSAILYIFTTSIVKGFALTLGIGVLMSLFSSIVVTRAFTNLAKGPWFANKKWLF